jgi:NAD(P)-dependent dehydrogenase (short-subunit alcohol dehydrogenase family)
LAFVRVRGDWREIDDRVVPVGHLGDPEKDIARATVFLASSDSDFIASVAMMVDGAQTILH